MNPEPSRLFHPLVWDWFTRELGQPTQVQRRAWPAIAAGRHVLVTAPTGSGKTMAAFLWAINQMLSGAWATGAVRVLYVSPLKALNNDIQRNLLDPLAGLERAFQDAGQPWPGMEVLTRSGDTPASQRRRMQSHPPEILITTPESLNLILSSPRARDMLRGLATVILDEIHAVVGSKRGTHLITAVERATRLSGEFQRIAISATVRPLATVADFVAGYRLLERGGAATWRKRSTNIVRSSGGGGLQLKINCPAPLTGAPPRARGASARWLALADSLRRIIRSKRSTLVFANSRRATEKITRLINEGEPEELAWAHHGSLSREIRLAVESRLKKGQLKAIVATSSLELGIDIGSLDLVILLQAPPSVSSAIQRLGRAGHGVHQRSDGLLFPLHAADLLDAAAMVRAVEEGAVEAVQPVMSPLDVLAQVLLAMVGVEPWNVDKLYDFIRCAHPYHHLKRKHFDLVLDMLAGRFADTRIRHLEPRVSIDRLTGGIKARRGAPRTVYLSGGTIPDRGYYTLRHHETLSRIGELDEEFVWERSLGDTFTLGTQTWRVVQINHDDVRVLPVAPEESPSIVPFWRADPRNRHFHLAQRVALFLEDAQDKLDQPAFARELEARCHMDSRAAAALMAHLRRQREATHSPLPHRHHLLVEHFSDPMNRSETRQVILHTQWGGRVNQPFSLAIAAAWRRRYSLRLQVYHDNTSILLQLPHDLDMRELLGLVTPDSLPGLLREQLPLTGTFGAIFRENAARALLLPRGMPRKRIPLWLNRMRAKKLLDAVSRHEEFPVLLETWRSCFQEHWDIPNLCMLLQELRLGEIALSEAFTNVPSPFSQGLVWRMTNAEMYEDDTPTATAPPGRAQQLIRELIDTPSQRPLVPRDVAEAFQRKAMRLEPGYTPRDSSELLDWIKECLFLPRPGWNQLLDAMERDGAALPESAFQGQDARLVFLPGRLLPAPAPGAVCSMENLPRLREALELNSMEPARLGIMVPGKEASPPTRSQEELLVRALRQTPSNQDRETRSPLADFLLEWLVFQAPISLPAMARELGQRVSSLHEALELPEIRQQLVVGHLLEGPPEEQVCLKENLEILLRMARRARSPSLKPLPLEHLPLFLAHHHHVTPRGSSMEDLQAVLEGLLGLPAPASAWEELILPARLEPYHESWLDTLLLDSDLHWYGCGKEHIAFSFAQELDLLREPPPPELFRSSPLAPLLQARRPFTFEEARSSTGLDSAALTRLLWDAAWKGLVANESFSTLRRGIRSRFEPSALPTTPGAGTHRGFNRWKATRPFSGSWLPLVPCEDGDAMDEDERRRDRVRQLLDRHGVIFRELLLREPPPLTWRRLFRTLRLMELSGEIVAGYFFQGIPGPQFASHEALRALRRPLPMDAMYFMNATDPASLCGLPIPGIKHTLPRRVPGNFLVFHGSSLVAVVQDGGSVIRFQLPPGHASLAAVMELYRCLLARKSHRSGQTLLKTVNDEPATKSPYTDDLLKMGFRRDYRGLSLQSV